VEFAARLLRAGGLAGNGCKSAPFQAVGMDLDSERRILAHPEVRRWTPELGRPVEGVPLPDAAGAEAPIALSVGLAASLGKHAGRAGARGGRGALDCASPESSAAIAADPVVQLAGFDLEGGLAATDATVVAVYRAPGYEEDKSSIVADLGAIQQLLGTDRITSFSVYLRDRADARAVQRDLASGLAAAGVAAEIRRYDDADVNPYYVGSIEFVHALVGFMGLLVAAVATLSVLNAMTLTILERTRELATFRSLGFTRRQVLGLFLREAAALTGVGVALGLALGLAAAAIVNGSGVRYTPPGVAAPIPLLVIPTPLLCASLAAVYLPLSLTATWVAVRRRVARPVAHLLSAVAA
ncbi:MAG TPA: FtsX-like permease family protein, partial [Anaeromyxobacteraceae bacterium]|nr:FtsX-like permease family protein [Anaeromyxobacteraceae bacterium]